MASIYRRGKTWWIHYLVNGQPVQYSLRTKSERVASDRKKKIEALDLVGQLEETSNIPFKDFLFPVSRSGTGWLLELRERLMI